MRRSNGLADGSAPLCSPTSPGFTRLSEQLAELGRAGAEELTLLLNATFECAPRAWPDAEGGDLVKYGGDALFLFFEGDGHAERASRAGVRACAPR